MKEICDPFLTNSQGRLLLVWGTILCEVRGQGRVNISVALEKSLISLCLCFLACELSSCWREQLCRLRGMKQHSCCVGFRFSYLKEKPNKWLKLNEGLLLPYTEIQEQTIQG